MLSMTNITILRSENSPPLGGKWYGGYISATSLAEKNSVRPLPPPAPAAAPAPQTAPAPAEAPAEAKPEPATPLGKL